MRALSAGYLPSLLFHTELDETVAVSEQRASIVGHTSRKDEHTQKVAQHTVGGGWGCGWGDFLRSYFLSYLFTYVRPALFSTYFRPEESLLDSAAH